MKNIFEIKWVLINKICLGSAPRNNEDILNLKKNGIKSVLSLCSIEEAPFSKDLEKYFIHKRIVLPDHRAERSIKKDEIIRSLKLIDSLNNLFPIFIHCLAGVERSPLICMAWLMKNRNLSFQESLDYLVQINPSSIPLTEQLIPLRDINFRKN